MPPTTHDVRRVPNRLWMQCCHSLLGYPHRRRNRNRAVTVAESCEPRCLLTAPTGNPPNLAVTYFDRYEIVGNVQNEDSNDSVVVEVDLLNDGTIDHTVSALYDYLSNLFLWNTGLAGGPTEGYDVALKPIASGIGGTRIGNTVVVAIPADVNSPPELTQLTVDPYMIAGSIEDDRLSSGGIYQVEIAVGSESSGYSNWGSVDPDGRFTFGNSLPQNQGMVTLFVRVREVSHPTQAVSNVIQRTYDSTTSGIGNPPPPGSNPPGTSPGGMMTNQSTTPPTSSSSPSTMQSAFVQTTNGETDLFEATSWLDELLV